MVCVLVGSVWGMESGVQTIVFVPGSTEASRLSQAADGKSLLTADDVSAVFIPARGWKVQYDVQGGALTPRRAVGRLIANQTTEGDWQDVGFCAAAAPSDPADVRPPLPPPMSTQPAKGEVDSAARNPEFFDLYEGDEPAAESEELRVAREQARNGESRAAAAEAALMQVREAERARQERAARHVALANEESQRAAQRAADEVVAAKARQEARDAALAQHIAEQEMQEALIRDALNGLGNLGKLVNSEEMSTIENEWTFGFCQSVVGSVRPVVEVAILPSVSTGCAALWSQECELRDLFNAFSHDQRAADIAYALPEIASALCNNPEISRNKLQVYGLYSFCALCILGRGYRNQDNKELVSKEDAHRILRAMINTVPGWQAFADELAEVLGSVWESEESTQNIMLALFGIGCSRYDEDEGRQSQWREWLLFRASTINN